MEVKKRDRPKGRRMIYYLNISTQSFKNQTNASRR